MASRDESGRAFGVAGGYAGAHARKLRIRLLLTVAGSLLVLLTAGPILGLRGLALVIVELAAIGLMIGANRLYSPRIDNWLQGAEGERNVAAVLEELKADGWQALHDVSLGRGNIDHILVGPGGIYTIETKSRGGRIEVDRIGLNMLKQAYAEKKLLERITGLDVVALLVFSRAWLIGSVPARRNGVTILPARMLQHYFSRRRPTLEAEDANQVYRQLSLALEDVT